SVFDPAWRVAASLHGLERRVAETWPFRGGARRAGGWGADTSTSSKSEWVASFSPRLIGARWRPKLAASSELGREIAVDLKADTDLDEGWGHPSHDQFLSMRRRPPTKLQSLKHLHDGLISVPCRSPSAFISLSRSRPNVFGATTSDEEITMRPTRPLVRAALSASLLSTLPLVLGVSALLAECSLAIAGENVLKGFRPVTDDMLQKPDPGDWLMRRGGGPCWRCSAPPATPA